MYIRGVNNQYVTNAAFLISVHSDYQTLGNLTLQCQSTLYTPDAEFAFSKFQVWCRGASWQLWNVVVVALESRNVKLFVQSLTQIMFSDRRASERIHVSTYLNHREGRYILYLSFYYL